MKKMLLFIQIHHNSKFYIFENEKNVNMLLFIKKINIKKKKED